ncbi:MAG: methyltransferase [Chloroflexota bacterium]|nr:class I SAM-dependent methyltransferase [Ardenticatenaceae bacterium]GIK57057.1 MAG: methyltransferase [Chloroflexota bacterium]
MLANRLRKRQRHLQKWARRQDVSCYRLYERDIPEYPAIIDWYDGAVVAWLYGRARDETPDQQATWRAHTLAEIQAGLDIPSTQIFVKERARQQGLDVQYERLAQKGHIRLVREQGLVFEVNLSDYLDTGLFLDHRQTRALVRERAAGKRTLNLFAYTGSFTVYAAHGRARATTTVDLSQTYSEWAARNLAHNGFAVGKQHRLITADCLAYLANALTHREQYDLIICDPPTFSNSKRMQQTSFAVDRDHPALIQNCLRLLAPGGELYFSTNARRFKLDPAAIPPSVTCTELTPQTIPEDFHNKQIHRCWRLQTSP